MTPMITDAIIMPLGVTYSPRPGLLTYRDKSTSIPYVPACLLLNLARHANNFLTREELNDSGSVKNDACMRSHIAKIRAALRKIDAPYVIASMHGNGWGLALNDQTQVAPRLSVVG